MKHVKIFFVFIIIFSAFALLTGCGDGDNELTNPLTSSISGIASKGPIKGGTIEVYALGADGEKGTLLGTATTGPDGSYSVNLGSYTGDVLVEVSGGTYIDEAIDPNIANPNTPNTLLRAALAAVSGSVSVAVTPLTEIAVQYVEDPNTDTNIEGANSLVSSMVGVDIITTSPVDVTSETDSSQATVDQLTYGLMLATMSQMMAEGPDPNIAALIKNIKNDLLDDQQLDDTGGDLADALDEFLDNQNNKSGVNNSEQTSLDDAIDYITENQITPPDENISDLTKAKALVKDLRNTLLSIYNYQGVGMSGIVETPFENLYEELITKIEPELIHTVDRIGWIIESVNNMEDESQNIFFSDTYKLEILKDPNKYQASFTISEIDPQTEVETVIDSGSVSINDPNLPLLGSLEATMETENGELTADLNYCGVVNNTILSRLTLTGSLIDPNYFSIDFSEGGRGLYVDLTQQPVEPDGDNSDFLDIIETSYPTSIYLAGRISTSTALMEGEFNLPSIIWAENDSCDDDTGQPRPTTATFEGSFEELKNNSPTGVKFSGTITGTWSNAATYDDCDPGLTNFPQWQASFDGRIEAPARPTITTFLRATQSEYRKAALEFNYRRTNPDKTVVFLSGTGTYDETSEDEIISIALTNQNSLKVSFTIDYSKAEDEIVSGTIKTAGNTKMADIFTIEDVPMVKYIDDYLESII